MLVKFRSSISKFYLNYLKYLDGYIAPYLQEKKKKRRRRRRRRDREIERERERDVKRRGFYLVSTIIDSSICSDV